MSWIRRAGGALATSALLILAGSIHVAESAERVVHVQGRVVDPSGAGVAGVPVRLFKTRRSVAVGKFSSGGQVTEATRAATDANGYFEIRIPKDRTYDDWFLRCHDPEGFDRVMYLVPKDREITKDLLRSGPLIVEVRLEYHPDWEEVQARIRAAGEESPRGKLLRTMGLPEREIRAEGPDGPRDEWWYHARGVVYFFRDGEPAGFRRFEPVTAGMEGGGD